MQAKVTWVKPGNVEDAGCSYRHIRVYRFVARSQVVVAMVAFSQRSGM